MRSQMAEPGCFVPRPIHWLALNPVRAEGGEGLALPVVALQAVLNEFFTCPRGAQL